MAKNNDFYISNDRLKKAGVKIVFTQEQVDEYVKCVRDPIYFIKHYVKIVHVDFGVIPFEMWPFQEDMIRTMHENRYSIAKMPRQVGKCFCINTIVRTRDVENGFERDVTIGELYDDWNSRRSGLTHLRGVRNMWVEGEKHTVSPSTQAQDKSTRVPTEIWPRDDLSGSTRADILACLGIDESGLPTRWEALAIFQEFRARRDDRPSSIGRSSSKNEIESREHSDDVAVLSREDEWGRRSGQENVSRSTDDVLTRKVHSKTWRREGSSDLDHATREVVEKLHQNQFLESVAGALCGSIQSSTDENWNHVRNIGSENEQRERSKTGWKDDQTGLFRLESKEDNRVRWDVLARSSTKSNSREGTRRSYSQIGLHSITCQRDRLQERSRNHRSEVSRLSDIVERKFVDSIDVDYLQIWTDTGWQDVSAIHKTVDYEVWRLELDGGYILECADTHIVMDGNMREAFVQDLETGDLVMTEFGARRVISVVRTGIVEPMFDVSVDSEDHLLYTNGVLSHNTTSVAAYLLWCILFNENFKIAILANKHTMAKDIVNRIQMAYENLPMWIQQGIITWNKVDMELENGSGIVSSSTTGDNIRGRAFNIVYLDEFAFVPTTIQEAFFTSVYPTISSGKTTKIMITSTPNGMNMFYKLWKGSEDGKNAYKRTSVHWSDVPGRDEEWKLETIRNTSERQFQQEFETEFLGSAQTLISGSKLASIPYKDPIHYTEDGFKFYEQVDRTHTYVMVVDTARGTGLDYSAFVVFDTSTNPFQVVCTYRNNDVSTIIYPNRIMEAATYFNSCFILVETNDLGQQVADILREDLDYDGLISTAARTKGYEASSGFGTKTKLGVTTTKSVKRLGCATFKTIVEADQLVINDYDLFEEMTRFALKKNSYEAESGNDDLVMCAVLFSWLTTQPYFKELTNTDIVRDIYQIGTQDIDSSMLTPFGYIDTGREDWAHLSGGDLWTPI